MTAVLELDKRILLVCGGPGVGKSTLVKTLATMVDPAQVAGFYTESCYENQQRVGFKVKSFRGEERIVARLDHLSSIHVGRYGVALNELDEMMQLAFTNVADAKIVFIDELGKLESKSAYFAARLDELLASPTLLVISAPLKGGERLEAIKARADVVALRLSEGNAPQLRLYAEQWLQTHASWLR